MSPLTRVAGRLGRAERSFAGVLALLVGLAAVYGSTSASMVAVWRSSSTYSHGYFIVPAFLWMVWSRRHVLATLPVRPSGWALPILAVIGLIWLAGHWMALALPSQFALVALLPAALAGLFGLAWVRALLFPLAFLFFAVPFGESLVPVLMDWTADFTVAALRLSGVPVYRDGLHFDIPSGRWSVVDSCSGIRYLFACLALASLYGWTLYRSNLRRLAFLGLALVIAIVANWVRAYAIVMLGHLSNNEIATGADHLVYGAVFFTIIMALVLALGAAWREDAPVQPHARAESTAGAPVPAGAAQMPRASVVLATLSALLIWPLVSLGSAWDDAPLPIAAPDIQPQAAWVRLDQPLASWRPVLRNPAAITTESFAKGEKAVGLHIGVFGRSTTESKLATALNRLLEPDGLNPDWKLSQQGRAAAQWGSSALDARTGVLVGSEARLLAWQWYWVDGVVTSDPLRATALQLRARLHGRPEVSAWITVYTRDTGVPDDASGVLREFLADMSGAIDAVLRQPPGQRAPSASQRSSATSSSSSIRAWRCCAAMMPCGSFV